MTHYYMLLRVKSCSSHAAEKNPAQGVRIFLCSVKDSFMFYTA
jgi:hypothetical protein